MDSVYATFTLMILSALLHLSLTKPAFTMTFLTGEQVPTYRNPGLFITLWLNFDKHPSCRKDFAPNGVIFPNAEATLNIYCQHVEGLSSFKLKIICYQGVPAAKCKATAKKYPWYVKEVTINDTVTLATYRAVINRRIDTHWGHVFKVCYNGGTNYEGTCRCDPQFAGERCRKKLMCYDNNCRNGGTCNEDFPNRAYTCTCDRRFTGNDCESELKCYKNNKCRNGGKCVEDFENQDYTCTCSPRFTGKHCESERECYGHNNCKNGGKCEEDFPNHSYTCACTPRFTGQHCETESECYGHNNCKNGGKCEEDFPNHSYTCACLPGFTGKHCKTEVPKCYSNPCKGGGTCHDDFPNKWYKCSCFPAFIGERCETVAPGECIHNRTCTFGRGTCTPIWLNATHGTYNCSCKSQYKGVNCEQEIVPEDMSITVLILIIAPAMIFCCTFLICVIRAIKRCIKKCCRRARRPEYDTAGLPEDASSHRVFQHIIVA